MRCLREAEAIVYFRLLRSVGHFHPKRGTKHFVFHPCTCRSPRTEKLPNGLPDPVLGQNMKDIVMHFSRDFARLCKAHFGENQDTFRESN